MSNYEKLEARQPPPADELDGSGRESDSELESRDGARDARTSIDIRRKDRGIIEDEEEVEKLLSGDTEAKGLRGLFKRKEEGGDEVRLSNRERRQLEREAKREVKRESRKQRRHKKRGEESELMYEMEEGGHRESSESSGNSSEVDRQKLEEIISKPRSRKARAGKIAGVHIVIFIAFLGLIFGAYKASKSTKKQVQKVDDALLLSNGTSSFAPTTILVSLDGFRADFLHRNITPNLNALVSAGVSPQYMLPSFPSVTFPNHFTLVTGLYPESHGVVGNTFWDIDLQEEFYYTDPARSMQPKWWQGEPIWVTAEDQGVRTAIHMWPGSEAHIGDIEPAYVDKYDGKEALPNKVNRVLGLLDLPGANEPGASLDSPRPQLIAAYVPNVDADGHLYGPNSTEIRSTIAAVDTMIGDLVHGLQVRNLTDIVNIIVVADHGMASTSTSRMIQLDDLIDMSLIEHTDGWPLYGLRPKNEADLGDLYIRLKEEAYASGNFEVYLRDNDMPDRYHFSYNKRIAPLWMVPKTGWAIVTREDFDIEKAKKEGLEYHPKGLHGYDHEHPLMRAIFIAKGPAFPHTPGSKLEPFQNIEVYNIVCDSLGVEPKPNNGTLRLPLKPSGVHETVPAGEVPEDPDTSVVNKVGEETTKPVEPSLPSLPATPSSPTTPSAPAEPSSPATPDPPTTPDRPEIHDGLDQDEEDGKQPNVNHWWDWVHGKLDGIKDWASSVFNRGDNGTTPAT
ncbi:hypothetical protein M8818_002621 [Zalaria obscura]|uniref:Uncharacterized protein n=1 Tax=Zalaria obscura TaxID=2024903 RepID=A0ACC3SH99_9PEZI